jgi:hypothetical protein
MSEKPFKDAEAAIGWIVKNCKTCRKWDNCDITRSLITAYVRLDGDVTYAIATRIGYKKGKEPKCMERIQND